MSGKKISLLTLSLIVLFVSSNTAFGWNAEYVNNTNELRNSRKGHNWITNEALTLLKERGMMPNFDRNKLKYVHYGVTFADEPWLGRPDDPDGIVRGLHYRKSALYDYVCPDGYEWRIQTFSYVSNIPAGDKLSQKAEMENGTFDWPDFPAEPIPGKPCCKGRDCVDALKIYNGEYKYLARDAWKFYDQGIVDWGGHTGMLGQIQTSTYYGKARSVNDNIYLKASWFARLPEGTEESRLFAGDNLFHYTNTDPVTVYPVRDPLESLLAEGTHVYDGSTVGAPAYGSMLFQLARKFWPYNFSVRPKLSELEYAGNDSRDWKTGRTVIQYKNIETTTADLPSTYLGGQPFTCKPEESFYNSAYDDEANMCLFGDPSWPIWVPEKYEVREKVPGQTNTDNSGPGMSYNTTIIGEGGVDSSSYYNAEQVRDVEKFHDELTKESPAKSQQAALIYLGWAMHMLQDMAMPHHVRNFTGKEHSSIENHADQLIIHAESTIYDAEFWDEVDEIFGSTGNRKDRSQVCNELGLGRGSLTSRSLNHEAVEHIFDEVIERSGDNYFGSMASLVDSYHGLMTGRAMMRYYRNDPHMLYTGVINNPDGPELLRKSLQNAVIGSMKLAACMEPWLNLGTVSHRIKIM